MVFVAGPDNAKTKVYATTAARPFLLKNCGNTSRTRHLILGLKDNPIVKKIPRKHENQVAKGNETLSCKIININHRYVNKIPPKNPNKVDKIIC